MFEVDGYFDDLLCGSRIIMQEDRKRTSLDVQIEALSAISASDHPVVVVSE